MMLVDWKAKWVNSHKKYRNLSFTKKFLNIFASKISQNHKVFDYVLLDIIFYLLYKF